MISFELRDQRELDELDVYLDVEGLAALLAQLRFLEAGNTDHIHLMAESWGGTHLGNEPLQAGATPLRHVKISLV